MVLTNIVELEIRKQRNSFLSVLMLAAVTLITALCQYFVNHRQLPELLKALSVAAVYCLPAVGFLFGVAAAAGLRSQEKRMIEESLPFSPAARAFGAYLTSLLLFAAIAIPVAAWCNAAGEIKFFESWLLFHSLWFGLLAIIYIHLLAYLCSYWAGQPLIGAGVSIVLIFLTVFGARGFDNLTDYPFYDWRDHRLALYTGSLLLFLAAALAALLLLARFIERTRPLKFLAIPIGAAVCLPALFAFGAIFGRVDYLQTSMSPAYQSQWLTDLSGDLYRLGLKGTIFRTPAGSVVRVSADGSKQVLYHADPVRAFEQPSFSERILSMIVDPQNDFWMLICPDIRKEDTYEVWKTTGGSELKPFNTIPSDAIQPAILFTAGKRVWIFGSSTTKFFYAELKAQGKAPEWRESSFTTETNTYAAARSTAGKMLADKGQAAELSDDRTILKWSDTSGVVRHWALTGEAEPSIFRGFAPIAPAFQINHQPAFVLAVRRPDREIELIECRPDGSIQNPWNRSWGKERVVERRISGGSIWITGHWSRPEYLIAISSEGRVFPALAVENLYHQTGMEPPVDNDLKPVRIWPIRIYSANAWLLFDDSLLQVALSNGRILKRTALLADETAWGTVFNWPSEDGVYYVRSGRIKLVSWEGQIKDLGKAHLPRSQ